LFVKARLTPLTKRAETKTNLFSLCFSGMMEPDVAILKAGAMGGSMVRLAEDHVQ
jgi:hypothetical protein